MSAVPLEPDHPTTREVLALFHRRGGSQYGHEEVSQLEHALQAAWLAESEGASAALVVAALLHDIGHLLHTLPDDAPESGIDDRHECLGAEWLYQRFGPEVIEPVKLHVSAKRYLCAVDPTYLDHLSPASRWSLTLQGGPMSEEEVQAFERMPGAPESVRLRRWDDAAKIPRLPTPHIEHFAARMNAVCLTMGISQ